MTVSILATVQELAARFADDERNLTLYFPDFDAAPVPGSLNQVFGPPVGLTDEQWPTFPELAELLLQADSMKHWDPRDHRMEHVFTVDLRGVELPGVPDDAIALMLFISNASFHRASRDGNQHTTVRFLREQDLRQGVYQGSLPRRSLYRWSRRFTLVAVDVPGDVFDVPELGLPADDPLVALYEAIGRAPARLGGCPIWACHDEPAQAWAESSPTRPWSGSQAPAMPSSFVRVPPAANLTRPYSPALVAPRVDESFVDESSRTVPFDPHAPCGSWLRADRLLERNRTLAYDDGDPASALTFGRGRMPGVARHDAPEPRTPFLMQFQRGFAEVNLGQRGVMYVSGRGAYVPSP